MALISLPFPLFTNGTASDGGQVTSNFSTIVNAINGNIDNTNIGAAGIFASQIKGSSSILATFTASTTGFTFLSGAASITPLTSTSVASASVPTGIFNMGTTQSVDGLQINGAASITGNLFAAYLTSGGTKAFSIGATGIATVLTGLYVDGTSGGTAGGLHGGNTTNGLLIQSNALGAGNVGMRFDTAAFGSTQWTNNSGATLLMSLNSNGGLQVAPISTATTGLNVNSLTSASAATAIIGMGISQSAAGLLINGAASITGNLLQADLTSAGTHALQLTAGGVLSVGAVVNVNANAGDIVAARTGATGGYWFGSTGASSGITSFDGTSYHYSNVGGTSNTVNIVASTGVYTAVSDATLKKNIVPIVSGLDTLMKLNPVTFDWISTDAPGHGFLAQEVQGVLPDAVCIVDEKSGILGISDVLLTPYVVAAIQDMATKLKAAGVAGF